MKYSGERSERSANRGVVSLNSLRIHRRNENGRGGSGRTRESRGEKAGE